MDRAYIVINKEQNLDENGRHGHVEHASIGNAIIHVFYADDKEYKENDR